MLLILVSFLLVALALFMALGILPAMVQQLSVIEAGNGQPSGGMGEVVINGIPIHPQAVALALVGFAALVALLAVWSTLRERRRLGQQEAARSDLAGRVEHLEGEAKELAHELSTMQADRQGMIAAHQRELDELRRALKHAEDRAHEVALQRETTGRETLHLLSRLQEKGRFLDFLMQDIGGFSDQQVGSASRFVHDGCRAVVREYLELAPVYEQSEGSAVTIAQAEGAGDVRFIGRSATTFPVTGRLIHRGWRVTKSQLPKVSVTPSDAAAAAILAPAQVELS